MEQTKTRHIPGSCGHVTHKNPPQVSRGYRVCPTNVEVTANVHPPTDFPLTFPLDHSSRPPLQIVRNHDHRSPAVEPQPLLSIEEDEKWHGCS